MRARKRTVVVVDDERMQATIMTTLIEKTGRYRTLAFGNPVDALEAILTEAPDAVITDVSMPEMSGLDLLRQVRAEYPMMPIIVITGAMGEDSASAAFAAGATDFVTKPSSPTDVIARLDRALARVAEESRPLEARQGRGGVNAILGSHPQVESLRATVLQIATVSGVPVLLLGESGTGKNLVARALHAESDRAHNRFIEVNCATLPDNLLEAELFGYEKGAFTDAKKTKKGLAELADGGTLFLDEVGTLQPRLQAKLLTFLESRAVRRVGGTEDIQVDLRIVAATNANLEVAVQDGTFREDLFYRINVASLTLPPLREIREDVGTLARHFLTRAARDFGRRLPRLDAESIQNLQAYAWPGNVRELRNVIERALIFSTGDTLTIAPLSGVAGPGPVIGSEGASTTTAPSESADQEGLIAPLGLTLDEVERRYIEATVTSTGGNLGEAAETLGVTRKVLWSRRRKHGMI